MEDVMEYIITGVIALAFAFVSTPVVIEFYNDAVNASDNAEGETSAIISLVLLLVLAMFYFFLVWVLYKSVQDI